MDNIDNSEPTLLSRHKVCQMLSISEREFYALIEAGKLHPIQTRQRHLRVPVGQVLAIKAEFAHRALALPYEKFICAATYFTDNALEINALLVELQYPKAPIDYIERCRAAAKGDAKMELIREKNLNDFMNVLGAAREILKRGDLRLMVELLTMVQKTAEEIQKTVKAKYGREFGVADILRFQEYFWNWRLMDPESVNFYMDYVQGRERVLKDCAYKRADYFIYYALGIDFGGEIPELIERSCLGLLHKFNLLVDAYAFGNVVVSQKDLLMLSEIISTMLGAAQSCRTGKVPKGKQAALLDTLVPSAVGRDKFFTMERSTTFQPPSN